MAAGSMSQTARGFESRATNSFERRCADGAIARQGLDSCGVRVINHTLVSLAREPAYHVGPHASQPDHSQLHSHPP